MPLNKADTPEAIGENIRTEQAHGKSHEQAVAIAMHTAKDEQPAYRVAGPDTLTVRDVAAKNREFWDGHSNRK